MLGTLKFVFHGLAPYPFSLIPYFLYGFFIFMEYVVSGLFCPFLGSVSLSSDVAKMEDDGEDISRQGGERENSPETILIYPCAMFGNGSLVVENIYLYLSELSSTLDSLLQEEYLVL